MMNSRINRRQYVDSLYVSRKFGDWVVIRTYLNSRGQGDVYAIVVNSTLAYRFTQKSQVREYIVRNDCQPVESF